ncbi:DNA primase family protein [Sporosarcina sp. FA9]|uniref:DNA primase family protein n=1 Tax=Sporosarcina sp. FA9 TaxID=3413030 RepID=UPI003F655C44
MTEITNTINTMNTMNTMNALEKKIECFEQDKEETVAFAISHEPLFQWVRDHPEQLNEALMNGIMSNLAQLGEAGELYINEVSGISALHENVFEKAIIAFQSPVPLVPPVSAVGYEVLTQLGYTGTSQLGDPASAILNRLRSIKFINRGLAYSPKGLLTLNANVFATYVLSRMKLVPHDNRQSYVFDKAGQFVLLDDDSLKKVCRDILHEAEDNSWSVRWENEYFAAIKRVMPFKSTMDPNPNFINLRNGMLNLSTMNLVNHDPAFLSTLQLGMSYNPSATCPRFLAFLADVFEGDQERIDLIQEMLGYCFLRDIKIQKAFIFLGNGSNGKSVLSEIIRHLIGEANVSNVPLSTLGAKFGMQNLPGKLVNISSENEFDKKFNTQNFKTITGGDAVNVEMKYQDSFNTKLFAKIIILLNRMMDSDDISDGYYRRLTIIPFNKEFKELKADEIPQEGINYMDKELPRHLLEELDGILVFALEGFQRLVKNKFNMSNSVVCEQALQEYKVTQNPIIKFYYDMIESDNNSRVKRSDFGKAFKRWASENGYMEYSNLNPTKFLDTFRKIAAKDGQVIVEKKIQGHEYFEGLRITAIPEADLDYVSPC